MIKATIAAGVLLGLGACAQFQLPPPFEVIPDEAPAETLEAPEEIAATPLDGAEPAPEPVVSEPLDPFATAPAAPTSAGVATPEPTAPPATDAPATGGVLGTTVASLGDPTQPGLWLKTPLVSAPTQGRITNPDTGRSTDIELLPLDGPITAGSQISIGAMQAIGASLTDLPTVQVSLLGS